VAASLPALLVLIYLQQDLRNDRLARIPDEALQQAELINSDLRSVVEGARQLAAAIARYGTVRVLDPRCEGHMLEVQRDLQQYAVVSVRDMAGLAVCSSNVALPSDTMPELCLRGGLEPEHWVVRTDLYTQLAGDRGAVLPFCFAFPATQDRIGFLVLELSLAWLADHIAALRLPEGSAVGVADREGTMLVRMPERHLAGREVPPAVLPYVDGPRRGNTWAISPDGLQRVVGYVPAGMAPSGIFVSWACCPTPSCRTSTT